MTDQERDQMAYDSFQETRRTLQMMVGVGMGGICFWLGLYNLFF